MSQEKPISILIVDDNKNNLLSLRTLIETYFENTKVIEANSGILALSLILKHTVDLIILDIQMPQMDGFETAKMIQKRKKTQHVPIVFMTAAYKSSEFQKQGFDLGAIDYLTKPIENQELRDKIETYCRLIEDKQHQKTEESTLPHSIADLVTEAHHSLQADVTFEHKKIAHLKSKLQILLNTIINRSLMVEQVLNNLGQKNLVNDMKQIESDSKHLLYLVDNVLNSVD
ncbi:MAG: response regulator [Thiomargarita sp.]|nr:response regulator [Thiomargarita sp.]